MADDLPDVAISVMQPWAWLIVNGHKPIENRDWPTKYRGPVAIHAGKKEDDIAASYLKSGLHPVTADPFPVSLPGEEWERGGIVGVADIVDCVEASPSEWFVGRFGFILANQRPVPFIPVKGALSFFKWRERVL